MFGKTKRGLVDILVALDIFMIMSCGTPLNTQAENIEIVITPRAIGDTLTSFT
jgi:hypothetical protein